VDLTISSMLLLAVRDLLRQTHGAACSSRLAHIQFEIQHTFAQPSWFSQISTCSSTISDFALRLSMRIHGRDCPSGAISERSNSDIVCLTDTARTIDGFITANITYQSPLFISSFKGVRGAVTQLLTHELLVQLLDPACDLYDESMTDSVPLQAEHHLTPAARVREHHACSIREFRAEEERILRSTGLEVVEADLRGLVKRMERIVGFNADVFGDVYAGSGMMVGS